MPFENKFTVLNHKWEQQARVKTCQNKAYKIILEVESVQGTFVLNKSNRQTLTSEATLKD